MINGICISKCREVYTIDKDTLFRHRIVICKQTGCDALRYYLEDNGRSYDNYISQCSTKNYEISTLKFKSGNNISQDLIDEIGNSHQKIETLEITSCFNENEYSFDSIGKIKSITSLKIANLCEKVKLRDDYFPTGICKATKLRNLQFSGFIFKSFPKRISDLTSLTELDLSDNTIETFPNRIGDLTELVTINMAGNKITSIPSRIGDLSKLENL